MTDPKKSLQGGDGLLLVHVQKDFCSGGALPVPDGDAIVPILNRWIEAAAEKNIPVYASRDWHPRRHMSFKEAGGEWPSHCVQDTDGARFHPDLILPHNVVIITSGVRFDQDQYSAFDQTGLAVQLRRDGVKRLWVGGLAQDVCVLESVLGARKEGFQVQVIKEATRALSPEGGRQAIEKMQQAGVAIVTD